VPDVDTDRLIEETAFGSRIKWLIALRLLIALLFLGSAVLQAIRTHAPFSLTPLYILVACTCLLSLVYLLLLRRMRRASLLCGLQLWVDILLVTALVHFTGGIDSLFAFVYIFPILAGAILISRRSSLLMAGWSSILYGALINLQLHGLMGRARFLLMAATPHDQAYTIFQSFVNTIAFFLVALLGSHLAERLRRAGRELEEQRRDLSNLRSLHEDIIANIPSGIMTLDLNGRIISFNRTAEKIIGLATEQVRGRHWRETPFREITQLEHFFSAPSLTVGNLSGEFQIRHHDGRSVLIGINFTPLRASGGELLGCVSIFQDLAERKQIEARLRRADRLAAVGQLAAGLAHEIRNPLAAISGSIQLMKEEGSGARPQLLDIILGETERLKLVTGQFLDFTRPAVAPERLCDLVETVEEAASLLKSTGNSGMAVTISVQSDSEQVMVAADPDQLRQVFWNLGLNAIQAMPTGGQLTLAVRRHVLTNGAGWAAVEFSDTGQGIPPAEADRIFDPFYTTKPGGTGLGLAIVRKIIDGLGGRIEVVSRQGDGATLRVFLRQAVGEAGPGSQA